MIFSDFSYFRFYLRTVYRQFKEDLHSVFNIMAFWTSGSGSKALYKCRIRIRIWYNEYYKKESVLSVTKKLKVRAPGAQKHHILEGESARGYRYGIVFSSVADPGQDPYVFGP
jgi:hypothetical protein